MMDQADRKDNELSVEEAWAVEIERRRDEIREGKAVLLDWDVVRAELLASLESQSRANRERDER